MKRILVFLVLLSAVAVAQNADGTPNPSRTAGFANGRFWRALTPESKLVWLVAYRDGLSWATVMHQKGNNANLSRVINEETNPLFPATLTWEETAASLDQLYEVPENRQIALPNALQIVVLRAAGVAPDVIDRQVAVFRRVSQPTPPPPANPR